MTLNVLTPIVLGPISGGLSGWLAPMKPEGTGFSSAAGETEGPIAASSWAFAVWGVIYGGLMMFTVYQALPSEWVPQRSDELIYVFMNLIPMINYICNASWFPFS
jgi:hypothetical protein